MALDAVDGSRGRRSLAGVKGGSAPLHLLEEQAWQSAREACAIIFAEPCPGILIACDNALDWLGRLPEDTLHAIVTDPPYGLIEYQAKDHAKLRRGQGGVWRIPPRLDGCMRAPLPRFTVLDENDKEGLFSFFMRFAGLALRALVPGGHLMVASNPLVSSLTFSAFQAAGFEKRGEIIRLVQTLRGGDRPKGAEAEFAEVTAMPRAGWEPWGLFRKPLSEKTVAANLRRWGTGGLRRISAAEPFRDVIASAPTRAAERALAPHPSLKPQRLMRQLVRAMLPLGAGVVCDPFAGGGSTLAAAAALGFKAVGIELDPAYAALAVGAIPALKALDG